MVFSNVLFLFWNPNKDIVLHLIIVFPLTVTIPQTTLGFGELGSLEDFWSDIFLGILYDAPLLESVMEFCD